MEIADTDLVVIGAGPGGYPAAFAAADHGMKVTVVTDEPRPGGVCLKRGCIPSKTLLHIAKLINETREAAHWGVTFSEPKIDLVPLRKWKDEVIGKLVGGLEELCKRRNVTLVTARATFADSTTLNLKTAEGATSQLRFKHAVIATGSSPVIPPAFRSEDSRIMDSTTALNLESIPPRLLVVGGGYIGLEMGSVYAALGSKVVVVEMLPSLLVAADRDLVRPLQKRLEGIFESIRLSTKVDKLAVEKSGITATLIGEDGKAVEEKFDKVLVAIGRKPNSKDLGLDTTKVQINEKGFIKVDRQMRTSDPGIFAIGDVAGEPMLAHKATREAHVVVEVLAGEPAEFDNAAIPAVVFTDPELAWCGLTENQAKADGRDVTVVRFPWGASGRAQALGRTEGLTKLIVETSSERVLGVGIVGAGAGELIGEGVVAVETAASARDLAESIHAHPTVSETIMEAAESVYGQPTHTYKPRK